MADPAATSIASLALLVSLASFAVAYAAERRVRAPTLVFVFLPDLNQWELRNVGAAPAHNVVVARSDGPITLRPGIHEAWHSPVLLPAIPQGGATLLSWLPVRASYGLGSSYTDAHRRFFTTKCSNDVSIVYRGLHLPRWPLVQLIGTERIVRPLWQVTDARQVEQQSWSCVGKETNIGGSLWTMRRGISRRMGGWRDPVMHYVRLWQS